MFTLFFLPTLTLIGSPLLSFKQLFQSYKESSSFSLHLCCVASCVWYQWTNQVVEKRSWISNTFLTIGRMDEKWHFFSSTTSNFISSQLQETTTKQQYTYLSFNGHLFGWSQKEASVKSVCPQNSTHTLSLAKFNMFIGQKKSINMFHWRSRNRE